MKNEKYFYFRPECLPIQCERPPSIKHGNVRYPKNYYYKDKMEITCEKGYVLKAPESIECLDTGLWNIGLVECEPITCEKILDLSHGQIIYNINGKYIKSSDAETLALTTLASFTCDQGFLQFGSENATCLEDGQWSANKPQCQSKENLIMQDNLHKIEKLGRIGY